MEDKKDFILHNKHLKVKDIAALVKCSPAYVCKVLKQKAKIIVMEGYFDVDRWYKQNYGN